MQAIWKNLKSRTSLDYAKYLISLTALLHLILSSIHIKALYQLETELCGLWMFLFILTGLICLFNAIRNKKGLVSTTIFSVVMIGVTCACGIVLLNYYLTGIREQSKIEAGVVQSGVVLAIAMMVCYITGAVLTVMGMFKNYKINKKAKLALKS